MRTDVRQDARPYSHATLMGKMALGLVPEFFRGVLPLSFPSSEAGGPNPLLFRALLQDQERTRAVAGIQKEGQRGIRQ